MSKKILVVDDSSSVRRQVQLALEDTGFTVLEACDGQEGVDMIEQHPDLALVICDISMPKIGGLELLEQVKANPAHAALPIVMLTTEGKPALIQQAKRTGAKGWIIKPFKPHLLMAAVQKLTA
jgi:two-component system, chemotaxis family, chemotaxis protein CheY